MRRPLRLWPGIAAAAVLLVTRYLVPFVLPAASEIGLMAGFASALLILGWWLIFSRAPWLERIGAVAVMVIAMVVTRPFLDRSIAGGGMGALFYILAIPVLCLVLVSWAFASRRLPDNARRASLAAAMLLAAGSFTLLRTDGIGGGAIAELRWRWTPTAEERLLAQLKDDPVLPASPAVTETSSGPAVARPPGPEALPGTATPAPSDAAPASGVAAATRPPEWPGFRGPRRDGVVRGVRIDPAWTTSPPVELWRHPIGPGWSSFAVDGDRIYTQEQRGDDEIVACYSMTTGEPIWMHRDATRFWESNAGPGPRATPTVSNGRVYAFGATGLLNAMDARTGALVWQRNAVSDTGAVIPDWGFSSSPIVIDDVVIVAVSGQLVGYEAASGNPRWRGDAGGLSYSSPHPLTIDGVDQVVLLGGNGVTSVAPAGGTVLWRHEWQGGAIVQPAVIANGDIVINAITWTGGVGTRRLGVTHGPGGWSVAERWTSNGLKPYFNDFVIHEGHAFGFDGSILASIDLADGRRNWKGGRYGSGQLILLAEQDLLLVVSEHGDLALVGATPDGFSEIARAPGIEGKTWNHPVLVGDVLLVRNGEEMAAFRLSLATR